MNKPLTNKTKGGSTGAVLASQLKDLNVTVVDLNQVRIDAWNSNELPISEPGLDELVELCRNASIQPVRLDNNPYTGAAPSPPYDSDSIDDNSSFGSANLQFTTNVDDGIRRADLIFVCVDTPSAAEEGQLGINFCTKALQKAVQRVGQIAVKNFILVEKCTVPCGTAKDIESILSETLRPGIKFEVLSNPEFLAEGSAVRDLLQPSRVLIGSFATETGLAAARKLAGLYEQWVPREKILTIDTWSSELSKLAANALLAQRISSINSLSSICESINADIRDVSKSCGLDDRIGPHMLTASVGFGGSCFQKDISYLVYLASSLGLDQVAKYWQAVLDMNEHQQSRFADRIAKRLHSVSASELKIAALGFAFKAKTNDSRNSAAIRIVKDLIAKGYEVAIYDPCVAKSQILTDLSGGSSGKAGSLHRVTVCSSSHEACVRAHAVVILTEWDEFHYPPAKGKIEDATVHNVGPPTPDSLEQLEAHSLDEMEIVDDMNGVVSLANSTHDGFDNRHEGNSAHDLDLTNAFRLTNSTDLRDNVGSRRTTDGSEDRDISSVEIPHNVSRKIYGSVRQNNSDKGMVYTGKRRQTSPSVHAQLAIQWERVAALMQEPKQIFDGRNIIADNIVDLGFKIERIGMMSDFP